MIKIDQKKGETRKNYLIRIAIEYIRAESGYSHNNSLFYDGCECDGYCLADDLQAEFDIED